MTPQEAINHFGITIQSVFVPKSKSRNRDEQHLSINWVCTLSRKGKKIWSGDYSQGIGHAPKSKDVGSYERSQFEHEIAEAGFCREKGEPYGGRSGKFLKATPPSTCDVLHSLLMDATAFEQTFEDWCSDFGYDTDSRKAEQTYQACVAEGRALASAFTPAELATLRESFQDY